MKTTDNRLIGVLMKNMSYVCDKCQLSSISVLFWDYPTVGYMTEYSFNASNRNHVEIAREIGIEVLKLIKA